ncbi:endoribonuclease Dicer [Elysia marginata]|uniref:ribonuclease III n=1 Tax=Elysia marginata TaxID=1093978 RepID=A0AAV4J0D4_9GAST|nr:endoribonuclease Dicer [Elysia marginata]
MGPTAASTRHYGKRCSKPRPNNYNSKVLLGDTKRRPESEIVEKDGDTEDTDDEQNSVGDDVNDQDMLPPYKTIPSYHNSPQVTMQGAIALVNRYCAKLPSDAFTHLTPHCRLERIEAQYVAYLRLPINSPVKQELQGPAMRSKKLAKMAVALEMCKILHEKGELDDQLLPVGKEMFVYEEEEEWADEDDSGGQARPGTTKRKQYYTKKVANAMMHCQPKPEKKSYLYLISLTLTGPITEEQNTRGRLIYAPEDTRQTLGLLLDKPIPQMPDFPVYTRSGEVTASVDLLCSDMSLSEVEISSLLQFHHFVFSGVLHLEKDPMEFNPEQAEYGCVVVPLNGKEELKIDWEFVDKVIQFMSSQKRADMTKRKKGSGRGVKSGEDKDEQFRFRIEDFEDAVVMPSYRNMDQPQHFYVAEIRTDLNPLSPFPSPELYKTFQDYYTTKYGLEISCKDQPLLDVDHTSARLNLLTPRYMNPKGMALPTSSAETKRARRENLQQKQILVPELCDVHIFPASLWRKAVCLPAILYRTNCLLLAEELRQRVANQTGIGQEKLPPGFRFPQLDFGFETSPEKLNESESSSGDSLKNSRSPSVTKVSKSPLSSLKGEQQEKPSEETEMLERKELRDFANDQAFTTGKMEAEQKVLSSTTPSPCLGTEAGVDKADSAASSDTDSGIMSSSSDTNLGPSPSVIPAPENAVSNRESQDIEQEKEQLNVYFYQTGDANVALSPTTVIASSSSTLPSQPCTKTYARKDSPVVTTTVSAVNRGLIYNDENSASGANHFAFVSHSNDSAAASCASQAMGVEKTLVSCDSGQTLTLSPTTFSKPITADVHVSSSKSSNEVYDVNPQGTSAARNVPCPSMPSTTYQLCIPQPLESSSFSTNSMTSISPEDTSYNIGCDPCNAQLSAIVQANPDESLQQPLVGLVQTSFQHQAISPPHSSIENHQSCVQKIGCDGNLELRSDEISSIKHDVTYLNTAYKSEDAIQCEKDKVTCEAKISHLKSSLFNSKPFTELKKSGQSASKLSSDTRASQTHDAAIIMNTLGQELSDLDIDLICSNSKSTNSSSTFQASSMSENVKSHPQQGEHVNGWVSSDENLSCNSNDSPPEATNDDDIIKFSFNTRASENSVNTTEKVIIDTWGKDEGTKNDDIAVQISQVHNHSDLVTISKRKSEGIVNVKKSVLLETDSTKETVQVSRVRNVLKHDDNPPKIESHRKPNKHHAPATPECRTESKTFDIGVWNLSSSSQSLAKNADKSEIQKSSSPSHNILNKSFNSTCGRMSLDEDRDLSSFPGPSPCLLLQALTMSNANDFFSLERLETIGDSFLKYAITVYLYCCYPGIHEGKLSYLRSKQVSNYNLYRLGRRKCLAERMVATKFEPYENWLPPGFIINEERRRGPVPKVVVVPPGPCEDIGHPIIKESATHKDWLEDTGGKNRDEAGQFNAELDWLQKSQEQDQKEEAGGASTTHSSGGSSVKGGASLIPYSLQQHHGLPDKSLADCVEALIGCYLTTSGRKAALLFMSWLGLKVLPKRFRGGQMEDDSSPWKVSEQHFEELRCPPSPMFYPSEANHARLEQLLEGFEGLEDTIQYKFRDRSYLLQAFTHASYHYNTITDCYQRIEFLGDAILDYVITRHLYEDSQKHSPGILTDLRSALVNNNIFAALAVKWGFHKYFKAVSPALFQVIDTFVKFQEGKDQDHIDIDEEYQEMSMEDPGPEEGLEEDDEDEEEEVEMEIPKALGDIFESVAGAIYLDSGMSLDAVWKVYYRMMKPHIDKYLKSIPKSPVRELLETEPETAKFERPQRTVNGKVRVTVNVVGKGEFSGIGRNYRIAKSAAAKRALRSIRFMTQNFY